MADLAKAVQQAMFDRVSVAGLAHPVVTVVPDQLKPPATVIAESTFDEIGGKASRIERHQVTIRHFTVGTSKLPLLAAMALTRAALHDQPLMAAGAVLSRCQFLSGAERRDLDENVLVGEQSFLVFAQDA